MAKANVADRLETFQRNIYPAMVETLAQELGLRSESLTKLGVGYVPVVSFKHGRNFNGWWCNPERDASGKVVGLSLRSRMDGAKFMYPGSKHGLIYPCQATVTGMVGYAGGSHNWTRLYDAGIECPLCGKPDGCLVSSDDPHDPKAVICIRTEAGAEKQTGFGWLHILKDEGRLDDGPHPLPDSDYPIVVVEGLTDTAAALGLGLVAVGRPNNTGGLGALADLVRGRKIVVVGENDRKADGDWPGKRGVEASMATLGRVCPHVTAIYPPDGRKDLREWLVHDRLGLEAFLEYVEKYGTTEEAGDILPDSAPLHMADRWLLDQHTEDGILLLRRYRGQWYRYADGRYELQEKEDDSLRGPLWEWSDNKEYKKFSADGSVSVERFEPTRSRVSDMVDSLSARCPVAGDHPMWLDGRIEPDPHRLICFSNGYLDVDTLDAGMVELIEPSPELFTLANLAYAYDPDATCPQWLEFLDQILGDDPDKILLLQEWFGLCVTPDMSYEKFMMFRGRRRSGKGTTLEMLRAVVGPKQVASSSFKKLGERFGRQPLVGKLCAFMSEARLTRNTDSMAALESLLAITGQDAVNVDRKNLTEIPDHKLMCRFTIAVNELPSLPDYAQALEPRLLILDFAETFEGREDWGLKRRLPTEAPGVALWALVGLQRLREKGVFTTPKSSDTIAREFRRITSPVVEFVEECCTQSEDAVCDKPILYDAWVGWCRERGLQPGPRSRLSDRVTASFPLVIGGAAVRETNTRSRFTGIELDSWAHKAFLGGGPG